MYMGERLHLCMCVFVWGILQDKKGQFVEFAVEDQVVGYIHKG